MRKKRATISMRARIERQTAKAVNGCWLWLGYLDPGGYGAIRDEYGQMIKAHRASWKIYRGEIPDGLLVLHKCDVRNCINPDHLFLGTQIDNIKDMDQKQRRRVLRGEKHGMSKLTAEQAALIKTMPGTQPEIAKRFGIGKSMVGYIQNGKYWKNPHG